MSLPKELFQVRVRLGNNGNSGSLSRVYIGEDGSCEYFPQHTLEGYKVVKPFFGKLKVQSRGQDYVVDGYLVKFCSFLEGWYSTEEIARSVMAIYFPNTNRPPRRSPFFRRR